MRQLSVPRAEAHVSHYGLMRTTRRGREQRDQPGWKYWLVLVWSFIWAPFSGMAVWGDSDGLAVVRGTCGSGRTIRRARAMEPGYGLRDRPDGLCAQSTELWKPRSGEISWANFRVRARSVGGTEGGVSELVRGGASVWPLRARRGTGSRTGQSTRKIWAASCWHAPGMVWPKRAPFHGT